MTTEKQVPQALEDHFCKVGAPIGLLSNNAKSELHGRSKDLLRMYEITDGQSEPEYQHQNPAERKIQDVKRTMNSVMDRTGTPSQWWLLAALFTLMLSRHLPNANGEVPLTVQTGQVQDISKFMHFHFWQEVFVESHKKDKKEELARWCYPAENCGDELTYMVLLNDTQQLVPRSNVRPARDPLFPNFRERPSTDDIHIPTVETVDDVDDPGIPTSPNVPVTEMFGTTPMTAPSGEPSNPGPRIKNIQDFYDVPVHLPKFSPDELIGLTFLHDVENGERVRAKIIKKIHDRDAENHERIKMLLSYDDGRIEELIAYNELCDIVAEQHDREARGETDTFTFREVLEHAGPITKRDPRWRGSPYSVKILWEDNSVSWEPLPSMIAADPVTMAVYAKEHGLLNTPGWNKSKSYARRAKKLLRMVNASKRAQQYNAITYKLTNQTENDMERSDQVLSANLFDKSYNKAFLPARSQID